ncbi:hypothetical protein BKA61DRAFT_574083 [Leptodontidium sp. MPI-SDFR-AT-0119]|nr:hypothetical protein BKA61DRAFT_574083 [Leptodontidium sp. MPI-SDFR-AT-0119]
MVLIVEAPSEDFMDASFVHWSLSRVFKPVWKNWDKFAPRNTVLVSPDVLGAMIEGEEFNFESGGDEELVGRHKDSVEEGDNSVDTGGEIHFEEHSFQSSDESSDEEE